MGDVPEAVRPRLDKLAISFGSTLLTPVSANKVGVVNLLKPQRAAELALFQTQVHKYITKTLKNDLWQASPRPKNLMSLLCTYPLYNATVNVNI